MRSLGQIDAAYDFGPDGLTFAVPARVTFGPQQVEQAGDTTRFSVTSIFTSHEGGVVPLDSLQVEVDLDAGTAVTTGKVSHFSPIVEVLYGEQAEKMFADFSRPEVVEVGEEFDVSLKIYLAEKLSLRLRPHEVIEQVRYTDVESVADRVAYLWLRCMAPGSKRTRCWPPTCRQVAPMSNCAI